MTSQTINLVSLQVVFITGRLEQAGFIKFLALNEQNNLVNYVKKGCEISLLYELEMRESAFILCKKAVHVS